MRVLQHPVTAVLLFAALLSRNGVAADVELHQWVSDSGHGVTASLVGSKHDREKNATLYVLKRQDGRVIEVPVNRLSKESRQLAERILAQRDVVAGGGDELPEWVSDTGSKIRASLLGSKHDDEKNVTLYVLKRQDGRVIEVPASRLSKQSRQLAERILAERESAPKETRETIKEPVHVDEIIEEPAVFIGKDHGRAVEAVAFSADGKMLASGGAAVKIWDVASGRELRRMQDKWGRRRTRSLAFSPNGRLLAAGGCVWDVKTGEVLKELESAGTVAFSPDGRMLAGAAGVVRFWDTTTWKVLRETTGHGASGKLRSIVFSPDSRLLAAARTDGGQVEIYDVRTSKLVRLLSGSKRHFTVLRPSVESVAFSPNGKLLASGDQQDTVWLWDVATGKEIRSLTGHPAFSLAFSPDGRQLLGACLDRGTRIWDVATGRVCGLLHDHGSHVQSVAWSPDGRVIAAGGNDGNVRFGPVQPADHVLSLSEHPFKVTAMAFSPTAPIIASGSIDGTLKLYDMAAGHEIALEKEHSSAISSIAFSLDGRLMAAGSYSRMATLWDIESAKILHRLRGPAAINAIAFSVDGKLLAGATYHGNVALWDTAKGTLVRTVGKYRPVLIHSIAFTPDAKRLVMAGEMPMIKLMDVGTGSELQPFNIGGPGTVVHAVAISPDGSLLAAGGNWNTLAFWDLATGRQIKTFGGPAARIAFSPDGKRIASGSDHGAIAIRDISNGKMIRQLSNVGSVKTIAFREDGKLRIGGHADGLTTMWESRTGPKRTPWDTEAGRPVRTLVKGDSTRRLLGLSLAFRPNGQLFAFGKNRDGGVNDHCAFLWNPVTGGGGAAMSPQSDQLAALAMSGDGSVGAVAVPSERVVLVNLENLRVMPNTPKGNTTYVDLLALSWDGRLLVTVGGPRTNVWDVAAGEEVANLKVTDERVRGVAFSPNGKLLATGAKDGTLKLWDITGQRESRSLTGHRGGVDSIDFSPDGRLLASGSGDDTVIVWDVAGSTQLKMLSPESGDICSVAFSPDGRLFATGGKSGRAKIWDVATWRELLTISGPGNRVELWGVALDTESRMLATGYSNGLLKVWDVSDCTRAKEESAVTEKPENTAEPAGPLSIPGKGNALKKFAFVRKWGSQGSGPSQFYSACGIAVDSAGNVYVADSSAHAIQRFSADGTFIGHVGDVGHSKDGLFIGPNDVATGPGESVYIADSGNDRVQQLKSDGTFIRKWGSQGSGDGQFGEVRDITTDGKGFVYVTDKENHRVQKFKEDGIFVAKWGGEGTGKGQFSRPAGIAVDADGFVYVVDQYNHRVQRFTDGGKFVGVWGSKGSEDGQFVRPYGITVDRHGFVYVVDAGNDRIQVFTGEGVFASKWGSPGSGDGEFHLPQCIAIDSNGLIYVTEWRNYRVQVFEPAE